MTAAAELASLQCPACPSLVTGPTGTSRRYRVAHTASCLIWQRYQQRAGGYTALPSGAVVCAPDPAPEGTTVLIANSPMAPCGAVVTWRGPHAYPAGTTRRLPPVTSEQAAANCALLDEETAAWEAAHAEDEEGTAA